MKNNIINSKFYNLSYKFQLLNYKLQITNAYIVYKKYMIMHRKKPMSHFNFQRAIAMAWINPSEYWPKPPSRRSRSASASVTSASSSSTSRKRTRSKSSTTNESHVSRGTAFSDKTLSITGALARRTDLNVHHWPIECTKKNACCQLHKWATGQRLKRNVFVCSYCNVTLCARCYAPFHTMADLVNNKKTFSIQYSGDVDGE